MASSWINILQKQRENLLQQIPPPKRRPIILAIAALLLMGFLLSSSLRPPVLWAVQLDGQVLGWVEDREELEAALRQLQAEKEEGLGPEAELSATLDYEQVAERGLKPEEPAQLARRLDQMLTYTVPAAFIMVEGSPVVVLEGEEEALQVLEAVREQYLPTEEGVVLEELTISERVEVVPGRVEAGEIRDQEEALRILLRGTDEVITHQVAKGESLWSIAVNYDLQVEDLKKANPDLESEVLQIGQELDLVVPKPYLTVRTKETMTFIQEIPYPTRTVEDGNLWVWERQIREQGEAGSKEVTWEILRENGQEVQRELLQEERLQEPVTQVVAIGTKMPVAQGTGKLSWPMSRGSITSRYGPRSGRMHNGVDIAAPTGSPINAADSGVVTMAQWYGSYGRTVVIDHGNGVSTLYGHCSEVLVRVGTKVEKGQLIARVGSTGRSSGPHLHFEVRENGQPRDPLGYYQ